LHKIVAHKATIDLNRISTFVRVVDAGSFTAAATALRVPTSSVSRAVARLEADLGARLLNRTTRKLSLTDAGQHFHRRMQAVVAETEEAARAVTGFASAPRGLVRLTAPHDLGLQQLPDVISRIVARNPGLVIELVLTSRRIDLVEEGIDLALRGGRLEDSSLVARKILSTELGIFAAPAYLDRRGRPRALAELARHDCLVFGGRGGKLTWRLQGPRGEETVSVSGPVVCGDMLFLHECALRGMGVTLLPDGMVKADVTARRLVRLLPRYGLRGGGLYLLWPSRTLVPARVAAVRELLAEELARLGSSAERAPGAREPLRIPT
jgi:DNA-binding transcriptional LysR family regulator